MKAPTATRSRSARPTATLFAQVMTLVLFSLLAAQTINFWIIFNFPTPPPEIYRMTEITSVLKAGGEPVKMRNGRMIAATVQKYHTDYLGLTLIFPLYGIFRYLYLVHQKEGGGSPADMLLNDRPLLACVALWAAAVTFIIYGAR